MASEEAASRAFRRGLVQQLQQAGHLRSPRIAAALEAVPREVFVPGLPLEEVYRPSDAIVTKRLAGVSVSSASAPEVVALMLEQLDPGEGERVLEIGAGTGYNAALLAHLVGPSGEVVTLDIDDDLVRGARKHLDQTGYAHVRVLRTDGALGCPNSGPFDRIILTVASTDIAPAWREQLAQPHGRLVMPLGLGGPQRCVAFTWRGEHLVSRLIHNCAFIPLRGVLAGGSVRLALDPRGAQTLVAPDELLPLSPDDIAARLKSPLSTMAGQVWMTLDEVREGLHMWLVHHQPGVYAVWDAGTQLPDLFGLGPQMRVHGTLCVVDATGVVCLGWADQAAHRGQLNLLVSAGAEALAQQVKLRLREWIAAGRPVDSQLQVSAYARGTAPCAAPGQVVVHQRWTDFVLEWNQPPAIFTV